ncbi:MAG: hypothetical protein EA350_04395 [Gemmatimonadales bacterium]|nr:MAG: hypothetical protein EA350_04395 [Gemmatimonadales bacterium]
MASLRGFLRHPVGYGLELVRTLRLLADPPAPDLPARAPRKPRRQQFRELLTWKMTHGDSGEDFFRHGLHLEGSEPAAGFMPVFQFMAQRDRANGRMSSAPEAFDYAALVGDKFLFGLFGRALGFPVPRPLALLGPDQVTRLDGEAEVQPLEELLTPPSGSVDGFCKPVVGGKGRSVFPLEVRNGELRVAGESVGLDAFRATLSGHFLLEERVQQHPVMARLHPPSVNTLRLVTVRSSGRIEAFSAILRTGAGGCRVDNLALGGWAAPVDLVSGTVSGQAHSRNEGLVASHHPDTGIAFEGFQVPMMGDVVALVVRMHRFLYGFHSLGWDVALTPEGPVVIEANDQWGGRTMMLMDPTLGGRFRASLADREG